MCLSNCKTQHCVHERNAVTASYHMAGKDESYFTRCKFNEILDTHRQLRHIAIAASISDTKLFTTKINDLKKIVWK